jgi:iodotyrosine deiodinase
VEARTVPYTPPRMPPAEMRTRANAFRDLMAGRRTVRRFSTDPVPREIIERCLEVAGTAPSGAHKQPWSFVVVGDPATKKILRDAAEREERRFYEELAPEEWLKDLAPLGTDAVKTHLTDAPWIVVVFAQDYALNPDGSKGKHYYVNESVGIAVGFFLAAIRHAGLAALTHTPSLMKFLAELFDRPKNERAYVVIPVGYPHPEARVPDLRRKRLEEFVTWDPKPKA